MPGPTDRELAEQAARLAGATAAALLGGRLDVTRKSAPGDVVSQADVLAEQAVARLLHRHRPHDGVLGEEGSRRDGARRWLVDAVDGTLNFVRGDPFWCSAVALEDGDGAVVSAVHHVAGGETFTAERGAGAHLDGRRLLLPAGPALAESVLATFFHPGDLRRPAGPAAAEAVASLRSRGSGTLELAWLAAGRVDVWLQRGVAPWDWVPGALLVTEAGGTTATVGAGDEAWRLAGGSRNVPELQALLAAAGS